jgi:phage gp36-like protein
VTYAVLADLIARAGDDEIRQIADRDRDGVADATVIAAALQDADNTVNGYLRTRFDLPLVATPSLVRTWAVSIARHMLHRNGPPDHVVADYRDAIAALKDVAAGRITLPDATGQTPAGSGGVHLAEHPAQVFSSTKLTGW